jgi:hypothetical protein
MVRGVRGMRRSLTGQVSPPPLLWNERAQTKKLHVWAASPHLGSAGKRHGKRYCFSSFLLSSNCPVGQGLLGRMDDAARQAGPTGQFHFAMAG